MAKVELLQSPRLSPKETRLWADKVDLGLGSGRSVTTGVIPFRVGQKVLRARRK